MGLLTVAAEEHFRVNEATSNAMSRDAAHTNRARTLGRAINKPSL